MRDPYQSLSIYALLDLEHSAKLLTCIKEIISLVKSSFVAGPTMAQLEVFFSSDYL